MRDALFPGVAQIGASVKEELEVQKQRKQRKEAERMQRKARVVLEKRKKDQQKIGASGNKND